MKVRVLLAFEDLQAEKVRYKGEEFECSVKRYEELIKNPAGVLVEKVADKKAADGKAKRGASTSKAEK